MTVLRSGASPIRAEHDVVLARQLVRKLSTELEFSLVDLTKMVTATSELARNTLVYGGGGDMEWEVILAEGKVGLRLAFVDEGPGIPDVDLALTDGWTSGHGLGKGLSGSKRLVNDFTLETEVGKGTRITIVRWKKP